MGVTSPPVVTLLEGRELVLQCTAAGLDIHLWYKDGKPVVSNATTKFLLQAEPMFYSKDEKNYFTIMKLAVRRVKRLHTGFYKCSSGDSTDIQNVIVYSSKAYLLL